MTFEVREGPRVRLGEVSFAGNGFFTAAQLRPHIAIAKSAPYVEGDVRAARNHLVQRYREQGFTGVKVGEPQITLSADRSVADVRFEIEEGTRFVISGRGVRGGRAAGIRPDAQEADERLPGAAVLPASRAGAWQSRDRGLRRAGVPGRRGRRPRGVGRDAGRRRAPRLGRQRAAGADQPGRRCRERQDARRVHPLAHPDPPGGLVRRGKVAGELPRSVPHGHLLARQPHPRRGRRRARSAGDGRGGALPGAVRGDRLGLLRAVARQRRLPRAQRVRRRAQRRGGGGRLDEKPLREGGRPQPPASRQRVLAECPALLGLPRGADLHRGGSRALRCACTACFPAGSPPG